MTYVITYGPIGRSEEQTSCETPGEALAIVRDLQERNAVGVMVASYETGEEAIDTLSVLVTPQAGQIVLESRPRIDQAQRHVLEGEQRILKIRHLLAKAHARNAKTTTLETTLRAFEATLSEWKATLSNLERINRRSP